MAKSNMIKIRSKKNITSTITDVAPVPAAGWGEVDTSVNEVADAEVAMQSTQPEVTAAEVTEEPVQLTALEEAPGPTLDLPAKPKANTPTVTIVLPYKGQSKEFVEVIIGDKQSWLAKTSLVSFEVEEDMVTMEMPRSLARRRHLLEAA